MKKYTLTIFIVFSTIFCSSLFAKVKLTNYYSGVEGAPLDNIKARMNEKENVLIQNDPLSVSKIKLIFKNAPTQINKALQPYGYFKTKISSRLEHKDGDKKWYAFYDINLGPPLRITNIDLKIQGDAKKNPSFEKFLKSFSLKKGEIFTTKIYENAKKQLFEVANNLGYLHAKMQKSVVYIDLKNYTASIIIIFNSGKRYFFGPAEFISSKKIKFSEKFLRKFLDFKTGEPYVDSKVQKTQQNFYNSNLFQSIIVEPAPDRARNLEVPVYIHVVPSHLLQYSIGIGYGTDTGPRGSLGLRLNNLSSNGQHFNGSTEISKRLFSFGVDYVIPGSKPLISQYVIGGRTQINTSNIGHYKSTIATMGYASLIGKWKQVLQISLLREKWYFQNQSTKYRETFLYPMLSWSKKKANSLIDITRGYNINLTLQGSPNLLGSHISFIQGIISGKLLLPIPKGPILVLKGNFGYTKIFTNNKNRLPLSFWFSAGGEESIKGYAYQSIGPGTGLLTLSAELRQKIYKNWYLSVFIDSGDATNNMFNNLNMHYGSGIGLIWLSPIGTMQISYAKPLKKNSGTGMVQFSIGPEL